MNLKPVTREEFKGLKRKQATPLESVINEFKKMDVYAVEIENYTQKDANCCVASYCNACRRMNCGVEAHLINGKPYLVRTEG